MQKQLCIRLSYHDVRMFRQMLESLPKQTKNARDHKNGNRSEALVQISFRDFCVDFDKRNQYETHVKISLRSLLMEDLLQSDTAKNRYMVVTSAERDSNDRLNASSFASHSCPNPVGLLLGMGDGLPNSLPTNLEDRMGFSFLATNKSLCPDTPPPSPSVHRPHAGSPYHILPVWSLTPAHGICLRQVTLDRFRLSKIRPC